MTHKPAAEPAPTVEIDAHLELYATTRAALIGLAETVPWHSAVDYDVVLELLDGLHNNFDMPAVEAPSGASKQWLYYATRSGIDTLTRYQVDREALVVCLRILHATWAADADHTRAGGER